MRENCRNNNIVYRRHPSSIKMISHAECKETSSTLARSKYRTQSLIWWWLFCVLSGLVIELTKRFHCCICSIPAIMSHVVEPAHHSGEPSHEHLVKKTSNDLGGFEKSLLYAFFVSSDLNGVVVGEVRSSLFSKKFPSREYHKRFEYIFQMI